MKTIVISKNVVATKNSNLIKSSIADAKKIDKNNSNKSGKLKSGRLYKIVKNAIIIL